MATKPTLTKAEFEAAQDRYREESQGYGKSVRYRPTIDAFDLELRNGVRIVIPRAMIEPFSALTRAQLQDVTLNRNGSAIELDSQDIQVSVPGLVRRVTVSATWLAKASRSKSPAKAAAARANGAKGGRPRKQPAAT